MKRYDTFVFGNNFASSREDPEGEWVSYEDYNQEVELYRCEIKALNNKIRRLETSNGGAEGGILYKVMDITFCSCKIQAGLKAKTWICPKHGYKKR